MKKVLFTSHLANFSKFNKPFMQWFINQGWEVHYASLDEEPIICCHKHFRVQFNRSPCSTDNIKAYFQLKKLLQREQYDIIHCHTPMGGVITRLAAMSVRKKNGTKVLYTAHGFHFYKGAPLKNWILFYPVEKILSKFTDCLITLNEEDYNLALKKFNSCKTVKINGVGVDINRYSSKNSSKKNHYRNKLNLNQEDFVLLCVAEFINRKNQIFLLKCLKDLKKKIPEIKIVFAGKGILLNKCKKFASQNKLLNSVDFLGYRSDIEYLCAASDLLVSASYQEGLPINIIEGMACGLPIVCTKIRGQADIIKNERNGFLFEVDNKNEFFDIIFKLYNNTDLKAKINKNNLNDVQNYSLTTAISHMGEIYKLYM